MIKHTGSKPKTQAELRAEYLEARLAELEVAEKKRNPKFEPASAPPGLRLPKQKPLK